MVVSGSEASSRYREGINLIGGSNAYFDCGAKAANGGVKAVAECMKGLKKAAGLDAWTAKYEKRYG